MARHGGAPAPPTGIEHMHRIARLVGLRLVQAIPVVAIVAVGVFLLLELAPGDAVDAYMAGAGGGTAFAEQLRAEWGLDQSAVSRFVIYMEALVTLDLGWSVAMSAPVVDVIVQRLPNTVLLMGSAIFLSAGLGALLGGYAALRRGTVVDTAITIGGLALNAMPNFWLGLIFMVLFVVKLEWFPLGGITTIDGPSGLLASIADVIWHLVLPVTTLALTYMALYLRLMRGAMIETQDSDWVRAARARGIPRTRIVRRHIARPALLPVVTMLGLQAGNLLGGSVVIETVYAIPGLGSLAYEGVRQRDLPLVAGILLAGTLLVNSGEPDRRFDLCLARPAGRRRARGEARLMRLGPGGWIGGGGLVLLAVVVATASWLAPGDPLDIVARPLLDPFADGRFMLGTDPLGRDVLAGLVHGARVSLTVGLAAAATAIGIGILVGTAAGFLGGGVDAVLMRVTEAFQTVPTFLLALAMVSMLGANTANIVMAIAISSWPATARLVRAEVLSLKTRDYVDAARVAGMRPLAIAFIEVLPGALQPVLALVGVTVGAAILVESALAFLGLGDPNQVSWGGMIANGRAVLRVAPHLVAIPGIAIAIAVLCVSLVGDAIAARMAPRRRSAS